MTQFSRAKPRTLRDEVVDMIRDAIVTGKLKTGERLRENDIAEQMSVSRSPVREALRQLEQEGLITSVANQGSFVRTFDEHDVREIFMLRAALEDVACRIILSEEKLEPADFDRLADYIEQQRAAIDAHDFGTLTKLDMDFHELICAKTGLKRLLKMWRGLRAQIQILLHQRFEALEYVPQTVDIDHRAIAQALREGDLTQFSLINQEVNARVARECAQVIRMVNGESA